MTKFLGVHLPIKVAEVPLGPTVGWAADVGRKMADHLLLACRRRASIGRMSRVAMKIPRRKTCSDF